MGRYVSLAIAPTINFGIRDVKPGFGTGSFRFFGVSGTFTVPAGISEVRITALGAGGCGQTNTFSGCCANIIGGGGGGGGYVVACVAVTAGCVCNVAAGASGGGASCFGTVVFAYGGCAGSNGTGGAGGNHCACSGSTCVCGRNGNAGCAGCSAPGSGSPDCSGLSYDLGMGGASGGPIGGAGTGPFPGTSGADIFNCKGFNGEDATEADLATKFGNVIRWPGDAILGTSRLATNIGATAAGHPMGCYCVSSFGGGRLICGCCSVAATLCCSPNAFAAPGFGGGSSGCRVTCYCFFGGHGYASPQCNFCCPNLLSRGFRGNAGTGYVVVEF